MALNYNTAEADLREVDADFAAGRLNAFGPGTSNDDLVREMKKVSELEVQVFIRTCAQLRTLEEEESTIHRTLRDHANLNRTASASFTAMQAATSPNQTGSADDMQASLSQHPTMDEPKTPRSNTPPPTPGAPTPGAGAGPTPGQTPAAVHTAGALHGASDKSFDDMAKLFRAKEASMKNVADNLRQMAKHVAAANEMLQAAHTQG